jgi:NUMOD4 motif/HNH endonuclease
MQEEWKPIRGYVGFYEVSNHGRIRSCKTGNLLSTENQKRRYQQVQLTTGPGLHRYHLVHRLVAEAFVKATFQVNHKDGNKHNNRADNLEWMTQTQNMRHASKLGLIVVPRGEARSDAKLTEKKVREILAHLNENRIPQYKLASMYDVTPMVISNIKHRLSWRHVTLQSQAA